MQILFYRWENTRIAHTDEAWILIRGTNQKLIFIFIDIHDSFDSIKLYFAFFFSNIFWVEKCLRRTSCADRVWNDASRLPCKYNCWIMFRGRRKDWCDFHDGSVSVYRRFDLETRSMNPNSNVTTWLRYQIDIFNMLQIASSAQYIYSMQRYRGATILIVLFILFAVHTEKRLKNNLHSIGSRFTRWEDVDNLGEEILLFHHD